MIRTIDSRYARYVGRVGALAFALGVGVAIANNPGVAVADTGNSTGSSAAHSARHTATGSAGRGQTRPKRAAAATVTSARVAPSSASSQAGNSSTIPRSAASFSDVLGFARRENEQAQTATQPARSIGNTFFARPPVLAYNAAQNVQAADGTITGTTNGSQANGYALTYTATGAQHGDVQIHSGGTFTYSPDADFKTLGGTDTFTVVADDRPGNARHWHGLATLFAPNGGATATQQVTVLENPGNPVPNTVLATADQLNAEKVATQIARSPIMQLAKVVLKVAWLLAARKTFAAVGGPDQANMAQLDQAVNEYANQAAIEVLLLDSNNPKVLQQVNPPHSWYLQNFSGARIWYDNPDTIYRFVGVNNASSYVITGSFDGPLPADTNFSVLTGLGGETADNINGKDLVLNPDGHTFTITADSTPTAPGQTNHLYLAPGTTLITTRNTLADWNSEEPMSLSILRVSGPRDSLFSQIGGFAFPGIGQLVSSNPLLTQLVSIIPPLPAPRLLQSVEAAAIMLLLGISGEKQYMSLATTDATTGEPKGPNVFTDPTFQASFLATQVQSTGYFQLADDEALVLTINPGKARYFSVPVTNDWTITDNYWDQPTSRNVAQSVKNPDGITYTIVVSPKDPGVANWVSTGGLNQGTIAIRFQDFDPNSSVKPTVSSQVVKLNQLSGLPTVTPEQRQAEIAQRQLGYNRRYTPYPQA